VNTPLAADITFHWGPSGIETLGDDVAVMVLVDILRFTTTLDVAIGLGARVHPMQWPVSPHAVSALPEGVELADGSGPRQLTLSPSSLSVLHPGDEIMLPSANGSHCSTLAARRGRTVVGASLRNVGAVAEWITVKAPPGPVAVVACGERWPDHSLRTAVEDQVGAGALIGSLLQRSPGRRASPAARVAAALFVAVSDDLGSTLMQSLTGRELVGKGLADDIPWAAAMNTSTSVPVRQADGAYGEAR
jgi:2-phosphosulfolactate phosphatase